MLSNIAVNLFSKGLAPRGCWVNNAPCLQNGLVTKRGSLPHSAASSEVSEVSGMSVSSAMSDVPATAPTLAIRVGLPNEIWGEIASFSSRKDILNLRATSSAMTVEAEWAVSTVKLEGSLELRAFSDACRFNNIKTLHLVDVDNAGLIYFAHALTLHPRSDLTIKVENSYWGVAMGLDALSAAPLAKICLDNVFLIESVTDALANCTFPIELTGYYSRDEFVAASRIATLTSLSTSSNEFNDDMAMLFASHTAVQNLSLCACASSELTGQGIAHLAAIPSLRTLCISEVLNRVHPITLASASALATNETLQSLDIVSSFEPMLEASFFALSRSQTLQTLSISTCAGMEALAHMTSLHDLALSGRCFTSPPISAPVARAISRMPALRTISFDTVHFEVGALRIMLIACAATTVRFKHANFEHDDIMALLDNVQARALTLVNVRVMPAHLSLLLAHPTLQQLTINGVQHKLNDARSR